MLGRAKDEVAMAEARVEQIATIVSSEAAQVRTELQALLTWGVIAFGGVLVVILIVVVPLTLANSRSITAPIAYAAGVAERIAAGDLSRPVSVQGQDEAAREIKGLIQASVERVDAGSRLVADAGATMNEIVASVQRVSDIIGEISAAASEQSSGIAQVNGAVTDLDRMTQQNAALVKQSAAAAESLKDQARRLAEVVGAFRLQPAA
jgi:methyl-accepting chemotaxis protein